MEYILLTSECRFWDAKFKWHKKFFEIGSTVYIKSNIYAKNETLDNIYDLLSFQLNCHYIM